MRFLKGLPFRVFATGIVFSSAIAAFAQTENVVYRFKGGADGSMPCGGLTYKNGSLYGTTAAGGTFNAGTVFRLIPPTTAGIPWTKTILYNFTGLDDGGGPLAALISDDAGNLYGTTTLGGVNATETLGGVVFELSPPATPGGSWNETVLHSFPANSSDGGAPAGDLVFDEAGNLFGVTSAGGTESALSCGSNGCGTVYQLQPPTAPGGAWTESVLYSFHSSGSSDGSNPGTGVLVGPGGVLYGTTWAGGTTGVGVFYKVTPPAISEGTWTEKVLHNFQGGLDGAFPNALALKHGALYGTAGLGGAFGAGMVFKLSPPTFTSGWTKSTIYDFAGSPDGAGPAATLMFDQAGNLYGTASRGGLLTCQGGNGCGSVYKLSSPTTAGGTWTETTLHDFSGGRDGVQPELGRLVLVKGAFFGTTVAGGSSSGSGFGTVFNIRP